MNDTLTISPPRTRQPIAPPAFVPLSQSPLWAMQRDYFRQEGIEAWRQNTVPSYVTSNPFIAHAYAKVALAYLEDMASTHDSPPPTAAQPLHILELGAGSGRFAYHFLRTFFEEYGEEAQQRRPVCYVMTDISEANIQFWEEHEQLRPYVARGQLDFAYFDACRDTALQLRHGGRGLSAGTVGQPLVCIANYVFDGIEQDVFEVADGTLYACLVRLTDQEGRPLTTTDREGIEQARLEYQRQPCAPHHYKDPHRNDLLALYKEQLDDSTFLLPTASFTCLEHLRQLSDGRLLLLSGDKGQHHLADLAGRKRPQPTTHGSLSLSVNYHALAHYAQHIGAAVLQLPHTHHSLSINAFLWGPGDLSATRAAYQRYMVDLGPDDFFALKKGMEKHFDELSLPALRALLCLSRWDSKILQRCHQRLLQLLSQAGKRERHSFRQVLQAVWEQHFFLQEPQPLGHVLGMLYAELGEYHDAIRHYQHTQQRYGEHALLTLNTALAHWHLGQRPQALEHALRAQQLDPQLDPTEELLATLKEC